MAGILARIGSGPERLPKRRMSVINWIVTIHWLSFTEGAYPLEPSPYATIPIHQMD